MGEGASHSTQPSLDKRQRGELVVALGNSPPGLSPKEQP